MKTKFSILKITFLLIITGVSRTMVAQSFIHPGILHAEADFMRMRKKVSEGAQPWKGSWDHLLASSEAQLSWSPRAVSTVIRGGTGDNVSLLYRDVAAAYQHALIWKVSGDSAHANKAVQILNAWSATHTLLSGTADRYLASGIFGYQFANAAEIMRDYPGFDLKRFQNYMLNVYYYPLVERFLIGNENGADHNDACITNYWANWDLCNMAATLAIGVLCDNREIYNIGLEYFKNGAGNGSIKHAVPFVHSDTLAQWQESGRDQGHTLLGVGLMSGICEIAWNQGDDLYSWDDSRFRKGAEYAAKYNLGYDVPFTKYTWGTGQNCDYREHTVISSAGRGELRPIWELIYNHYANRAGQKEFIQNIAAYAKNMRPDGGPGGHATTYDQPGFGSLTHYTDSGSYYYPWTSMDIGNIDSSGSAYMSEDTISINASGTGIQENADEFHFVFRSLIGNGEISVRVLSVENTYDWTKAGVMISENLDTASARAIMGVTPLHGTLFQSRSTTGDSMLQTVPEDGITAPYWLRIRRFGDTITGYKSANGIDWTEVGASVIKMQERVYIGLAGTAGNSNICTSVFDSIKFIQENIAPNVQIEWPKDGQDNYITGADVTINAYAYDVDDSVSLVEFYSGETKLGEDSSAPYLFQWDSIVEGNYTIIVKATDSRGATRTSTSNITVYAPGEEFPWYKFDETDGTVAADANNYGLDATLYGGVSHVSGHLNNGVDLDGINDYILLPDRVVSLLGDFTISTWVRLDAVETWMRIFDFGTGTDNNMFLTPSSELGKARFAIRTTGNSEQQINANIAFPTNKWTHIAVTLNGNTGILYIDGKQTGTNTQITFRPYQMGNTNQNYLGRSQWPDPYLNGQLDEFHIYNYAMSPREIQDLIDKSAPSIISIVSPLNDTTVYPGDSILFKTSVSNEINNIRKVEFFDSTDLLAVDSTEPYTFVWVATETGNHQIKAVLTRDNEVKDTSNAVNLLVKIPNKSEETDESCILIYPNPGSDVVYIKGLTANSIVQLFNQSGKLIREVQITNNIHTLNLNGFTPGVYIVKIINKKTILARKLLIK